VIARALLDGAVPPEEIRAKVTDVLARPEFGQSQNAIARAIGRIVEKIVDATSEFFGIGLGSAGTVLLWLVFALLIVAVVLVGWFVGRSIRRRNRAAASTTASTDPLVVRRARVAELRERASEAQLAGDHLLALRLWFTALVVGLGEVGDLDYRDGWTNRELLERGRPRPAVEAALAPLVGELDAKSFGGVPATAADATAMERLVDSLLGQKRTPGDRGARPPAATARGGSRTIRTRRDGRAR
jgi:hypothetical protein